MHLDQRPISRSPFGVGEPSFVVGVVAQRFELGKVSGISDPCVVVVDPCPLDDGVIVLRRDRRERRAQRQDVNGELALELQLIQSVSESERSQVLSAKCHC